ncbi:hypothetical protein C0J52_04200 [Blattella germanica]|nr:hypothetical protein C0J52_04200 [Blattella germanica]
MKLSALLLLALATASSAYPVFGTKRYGRSTSSSGALPHRVAAPTWGVPAPVPHYAVGPTYYASAQDYPTDDYYYAAAEPSTTYSYLPPPPPPVYRHQPYYYGYGYGYYDPVDDLQEEIHEEEEEEEAASALPQEAAWQRDAFLQNLIASQLYNDGRILRHPAPAPAYYPSSSSSYDAGPDYDSQEDVGGVDDEDVRELKSLVKKTRMRGPEYYEHVWFPTENGPWFENSWAPYYKRSSKKQQESSDFGAISFTDRKANAASRPTTTVPPTTPAPTSTGAPDFDARRGQKEIALLRPPTPARNPARGRSAASSGVYDTIKQLLSMEQGLRAKEGNGQDRSSRRQPQKRFVSNEETLVQELSGLKKLAA